MTRSFPVALNLEGKACLVVGSNAEAVERALAWHELDAHVVLVSPQGFSPELAATLARAGLSFEERPCELCDLDGKWLAVLTDRDLSLGRRLAEHALAQRVFFCATDQPQPNGYSHLALARAGVVTFAIGTEGQAPGLARRLREELGRLCAEAGLAAFAVKFAALRERTPPAERRERSSAVMAGVRFRGSLELPPLSDD